MMYCYYSKRFGGLGELVADDTLVRVMDTDDRRYNSIACYSRELSEAEEREFELCRKGTENLKAYTEKSYHDVVKLIMNSIDKDEFRDEVDFWYGWDLREMSHRSELRRCFMGIKGLDAHILIDYVEGKQIITIDLYEAVEVEGSEVLSLDMDSNILTVSIEKEREGVAL